ncbi:hypothetical protein HanOQP8_Chr16g0618441 [Helianthus annuus]|nr:hypothetical protein HanOQP8_Chr16g0618441 [Helianthus annuus]
MATSSLSSSSSKGSFIWFKYIEADPPTLLNQLWNGVNQSQKWHHGVFYTLSSAYALVALIALVWFLSVHFCLVNVILILF